MKYLQALLTNFETLRNDTENEPPPRSEPGQYHLVHETEREREFRLGRHIAFAYAAEQVRHMINLNSSES
jgi:hypothetical protein